MRQPAVYTDSNGTLYVTGQRRHHLFDWCDTLRLDRRYIRWNRDLSCFTLIIKNEADKLRLKDVIAMKQAKRPTRKQKTVIDGYGLNPNNWFVERDTPQEMVIIHRHTGSIRRLRRGA
ncbi:hypothetical protein [Paenibacillus sp. MSJ-34]|uniref:DUF6906 family protein n=1 Tax=Paenibacillus sp. MSJ-34 TaxID=2841529 RepID=UPI001C128133|nr:hypothetical protein [Paenibacillus sp. MSJ-34]MBU5442057.1 hypothetical protein [Paenibacillus sp. MSJ-34]